MKSFLSLKLALCFALREMRGGLRGFYIFLACIALGVAAIGGVNSVAQSVGEGIANQGQEILGGDLSFALQQRELNPEEYAFLTAKGELAHSATMRSMARKTDGSDQSLVEVKAVDNAYPLYGELLIKKTQDQETPSIPSEDFYDLNEGAYGAAISPLLAERLNLKLGDEVLLGTSRFQLRGFITNEPDFLSAGFSFAPRFLTSLEALHNAGLIQPGSLITHLYKLKLPPSASEETLKQIRKQATDEFPQAGWNIRTRLNASPSLSANIERFSQFLTLVGLTSLIVGGVGVANAVRSYMESKRKVIATFKSLGASSALIVAIYLMQISLIALIGIIAGMIIAALIPVLTVSALAAYLPVEGMAVFHPKALLLGAVFGFLTVWGFALLPLGRARMIPATALFRDVAFQGKILPPAFFLIFSIGIITCLALLAYYTSYDRKMAAVFILATIGAFIILRLVASGITLIARSFPRVNSAVTRLAIGNIYRPGALTSSVVISLGLGLTLMVALSLIDGNLRRQVADNIPKQAPDFFFVDIQNQQVNAFRQLTENISPEAKLTLAPLLRGRVTELNGVNVRDLTIAPEGAWVLRGDRGITFAEDKPDNATLATGEWWPKDYQGEPLLSFAAQEAKDLGLEIGDTVTINVLGRSITAKIANLRQVEWESLAMNFVMIFSPNSFAGAPVNWLATLSLPENEKNLSGQVMREVAQNFPTITTVGVRDALDVANNLLSQIATAIRAAALIAMASSILVLGGALAASSQSRIHDAVIFKTLGATRAMLVKAYVIEYAILGLATALFALMAGNLVAWYVVSIIMRLNVQFLPLVTFSTLLGGLLLTVFLGLVATWRILGQKPAQYLREL